MHFCRCGNASLQKVLSEEGVQEESLLRACQTYSAEEGQLIGQFLLAACGIALAQNEI